jgi:hypothetical protein
MFDIYDNFVWTATMWTAKVFGLDADKREIATAEINNMLDRTTITGQIGVIYDKWKGTIKFIFWSIVVVGGIYIYNRFFRRTRRSRRR